MKILFALCLLLGASIANAQQACTEMGCISGLTIEIAQDYHWKPGRYVFDFVLDDKPVHCRGNLPLNTCDSQSMQCSSNEVMIMESGCAMPPETQGFGNITLSTFPAKVSVKISRDSRVIGAQEFTPAYKGVQPNGSQCQPVCKQATVTLPLK